MFSKIIRRVGQHSQDTKRRWQIGIGFVIVGGLVGIGIIPARRGLTVRLHNAASSKRPARRKRRK